MRHVIDDVTHFSWKDDPLFHTPGLHLGQYLSLKGLKRQGKDVELQALRVNVEGRQHVNDARKNNARPAQHPPFPFWSSSPLPRDCFLSSGPKKSFERTGTWPDSI
jgi:hypothetical protein